MELKTIGTSGQVSFGKRYAGRTVTVEEIEEGVWLVKSVRVIPENELWLHTPDAQNTLDRAVAWAGKTKPRRSDLPALARKLKHRR